MKYLITFSSLPEVTNEVISRRFVRPIVLDKVLKFVIFTRTVLGKFHQKLSEAVISTVLFRYNFRPEVDNYVVSGVAVDYDDVDVRLQFGDSRSNGSRDIRGHFSCRMNERT